MSPPSGKWIPLSHSHVPGSFRDSVRGAWKGLNAEKSTPTGPYVFLTAPRFLSFLFLKQGFPV